MEIITHHDCHLVQNHETWSSHPLSYLLPNNVTRDPNFDVSKVDCIAGFIHDNEGKVPGKGAHILRKFENLSISNYYYNMLPAIRTILNITTKDFITLHWRRGDQLEIRCSDKRDMSRFKNQLDLSINCHSVDEFIKVTKSLLKRENISTTSADVVVATNEHSQEV